jgi:hypothetical protein
MDPINWLSEGNRSRINLTNEYVSRLEYDLEVIITIKWL